MKKKKMYGMLNSAIHCYEEAIKGLKEKNKKLLEVIDEQKLEIYELNERVQSLCESYNELSEQMEERKLVSEAVGRDINDLKDKCDKILEEKLTSSSNSEENEAETNKTSPAEVIKKGIIENEIELLTTDIPIAQIRLFDLNDDEDFNQRMELANDVLSSNDFPFRFCESKKVTEQEKNCIRRMKIRYSFSCRTLAEITGRSYSSVTRICRGMSDL